MSENKKAKEKKYWWLKFKSGWYESDNYADIIGKAGGENGFLHQSIYLRLLNMVIETDGRLRYEGNLTYTPRLLSIKIGVSVQDINAVLDIAQEIGAVIIEDDGTIYLPALLKDMVGSEGASAGRQRKYRANSTHNIKHIPSQSDGTASLCDIENRDKSLEFDEEEHLPHKQASSACKDFCEAPTGLSICALAYKHNLGKMCNPAQLKYFSQRLDLGFDPEIIALSIREAALRNANDIIAYINTCLEDWRVNGWKTVEDVENGLVEREFSKNNKDKI